MTDSITIFDDMTPGSVKGMAKDTGAGKADLLLVPVDQLQIAEGFNVRVHDAEYTKHIDWLAAQMVANGYDRTKPMSGYVVKGDDGANLVYITDGHSRHAAVLKAIEQGAAIETIPVIVHPAGTSAEDLTVALVTANSGKPLNPFEIATVCKRLQGYGHDDKAIAAKLGYTVPYVKNLFTLLSASKQVRDMVTSGKVSASLAVATVKKSGKDAAKVLKDGLAAAEAKGKKKVTGKHVKAAPVPAAVSEAPTLPDNVVALITRMADYIRTVAVGDDASDLLDEAALVTGARSSDSTQQGQLFDGAAPTVEAPAKAPKKGKKAAPVVPADDDGDL